ncbi:MAG: argininosuccinate lyase [Oscillospiraceae bacterium]|nr:argininosuccinate lyase [Oscillospiraceae bacterium]MCL2195773.1 argininosuccinate lyase [Oscillospiraceae bacterium]
MANKLWAGRFAKQTDQAAHDFNASIAVDSRMFREDITGSLAHAAMLAKQGIITAEDGAAIERGLRDILAELESGTLAIDMTAEDIHSFIEGELTARIGEAGKRLHTGRSRNDQVATDLRLYLRGQCDELRAEVQAVIAALQHQRDEYPDAIMPGYTHLQRAQPILFAQHLLAYQEMLRRDISRLDDCQQRMNVSPLGSGALAGTGYAIDRAHTAAALGFDGYTASTLDGVSDRDFCMELAAALSIIMVHLSRLCEELILWCSWEFRFVEHDDAYTTGSSMMPQKKNPDLAELIRGKSGRVFGDLTALLTMMKGQPLAYNKDMQEDKPAIFDAVDTVRACLQAAAPMLATMKAKPEHMRRAAAEGFINATDCADYLVARGMPFRTAYKIVGELVAQCIAAGCTFETLPLAQYQAASELFGDDIYAFVALEACVQRRIS